MAGGYFGVLGVKPRLGRWFTEEERGTAGAGDVIVISERLWTMHLGRSPDLLVMVLRLNARPYQVIGVAPAGSGGTDRMGAADVWPPPTYGHARHMTSASKTPGRKPRTPSAPPSTPASPFQNQVQALELLVGREVRP